MKTQTKIILFLVTVVAFVALGAVAYKRGPAFYRCVVAGYDLGAETEFSFISGKCMKVGKDGRKVYINQMREFGDGAASE